MRIKKLLALATMLLMVSYSVLGCGKPDSTEKDTKSTDAAEKTPTKAVQSEAESSSLPLTENKVTLTLFAGSMDSNLATIAKDYNENYFFQELEKRTNVHIEFQTVPQGSTDAFNLMIASGKLPDLIMSPNSYMDGLDAGIDDGYFLDLSSYLDSYLPDYNKIRSQNDEIKRDTATDSGRIAAVYQIFQSSQPPFAGLMIRKDWLDELGLEVPKTVSEWETVLTAFKDKKGAYAPLAVCGGIGNFSQGFSVSNGMFAGSFLDKNGTVTFNDTSDDMKAFLTVFADWYKKGLIDPDFMTKQNAFIVDTAMVTTDQTGAFFSAYTMADMYKAASQDPDFELIPVGNPIPDSGEAGKIGLVMPMVGFSIAVSADSENKEIAMKWINYLFTEEGALLANYGIEGDTFKYSEEGKPVYTEKITKNTDGLSMSQAISLYTLPPACLPCYYDWTRELAGVSENSVNMMYEWEKQSTEYNYPSQATLTSDENREYANLYNNVNTYSAEVTTQFITGVKDINTDWDEYVKTIDSMDVERCIELKQIALDRYLKR